MFKQISQPPFLFIITLILFVALPVLSQPHIVGGTVNVIGQGSPDNGEIRFQCFLKTFTGNAGDTLTESSVDCGYADGYYWVQTNNFQNPWVHGLTMHIDLWETERGGSTSGEITLTNNALDTLNLIILDLSLPVVISSFSVEPLPEGVSVKWATHSEVENQGFILDRSDGPDSTWLTIASYQTHELLVGQGNTSSMTNYAYLDRTVEPGQTYQYRLSDVNTQEVVHSIDIVEVTVPDYPTEPKFSESPNMTALSPPYPNPFNPTTLIRYQLSDASHVELSIYDIRGTRIHTLIDKEQHTGSYSVYWHGRDNRGFTVPSGTYILVLRTPDQIKNQRAILVR
jgi:hypothetical protein